MKAALIGMGVIGKVHRDVLREQGIELAAVCDVLPERREGAKRGYDDYREMILRKSPDVVHICTPHYLHTEMIVFALEHGCNVLCEKPLTIHLADIDRIMAAEDASSGMLGVCLQNRYNPSSAFAKRYLVGKKIDRAYGEVRWHRDAGYYASGEWRGRWATEGGGVLINQAIHTVDLLQWLCGDPTDVTGSMQNISLKGVIEVEDTAHLHMEGKTPCELFATNTAKEDHPAKVKVVTEGKTLEIYPDRALLDGEPVPLEQEDGWYGKRMYGKGHSALIAHFYDCVSKKEKFPLDGREGSRSVRTVLTFYDKCRRGM